MKEEHSANTRSKVQFVKSSPLKDDCECAHCAPPLQRTPAPLKLCNVIDKSHISFVKLCRVSVVDAKSKGLSDGRVVCVLGTSVNLLPTLAMHYIVY